jgi:hypothetical protein
LEEEIMNKTRTMAMGAALVFCIAFASAATAAVNDFARCVPKEALVYIGVEFRPDVVRALQESPGYKMQQDERFKALMTEFYDLVGGLCQKNGVPLKDMGLSFKDLEDLQEGGFAFAGGVIMRPTPDGEGVTPAPDAVMLFDTTAPKAKGFFDKAKKAMDVLVQKKILKSTTPKVEGTEATVYEIVKTENMDEMLPAMVMPAIATSGEVGIIALHPESLSRCLKVISGAGKESLAENELYKKSVEKLSKKRMCTVFENIESIVNFVMRFAPLEKEKKAMILDDLGLKNIKAMAASAWADKDGSYCEIYYYIPELKTPFARPFLHTMANFDLVKGISKYSAGFAAVSFDAPELLQIIRDVAKSVGGEDALKAVNGAIEDFNKEAGFNLEEDLLKSLGHEMIISMPLSLEIGAAPSVLPLFVAVEIKDRQKVEGIINGLLKKAGATIGRKKVGENMIYTHPFGSYCFTGKYLVVSNTPTRIEEFLDTMAGKNLSVANTEYYDKAMKFLEGKKSMLLYMNVEQGMRLASGILFMIENQGMFRAMGMRLPFGRNLAPEMKKLLGIEGKLLAIVPEYCHAFYMSVAPDDNGIMLKIMMP